MNTFLTLQNIARQTMIRLIDNLVMPQLCIRDYENTFSDMGDTVRVKRPVKLTADDFTVGTSVSAQDIKEDAAYVKLDKLATVDVKWDVIESAVNVSEAKLNADVIEPAAAALATKINRDGLAIYSKIPTFIGTAGTTPDGIDDLANVRKQLNIALAPTSQRVAVWDPIADAALSQIDNLRRVNEAGTNAALREGELGRLYGLANYMSQGIANHVCGTLAAGGTSAKIVVDGAVTNSDTVKLTVSATASGTLTGKVKAGDFFTVAGKRYVIGEDATAASDSIIVKLNEKVTLADETEVTFNTTSYTANLAFHRNAIAFVNRPLPMPAGGAEGYVTNNPYNGLSLRVVRGYDIDTKTNKMSIDILYGYALVYPELALVYMG